MIWIILYFTIFITLAVAYVNGWTDAPNSIAACVSTKALPLKSAIKLAAVSDFIGSVTVGLLSGKVSEKISYLSDCCGKSEISSVAIFSAMLSVVIFAVIAWYFGIPTSESHALLAGIFGSSLALNGGIGNVSLDVWLNTIIGLVLSLVLGFISGYILSVLSIQLNFSNAFFINSQILSAILSAFMHGAQDSQKFVGILMSFLGDKPNHNNLNIIFTLFCGGLMALGTATGGDRIIKTVGSDMVYLNNIQGFSADFSGLGCLIISTLIGLPVSTTHIKTASILGAGLSGGNKNINKNIVSKMISAWIITFPVCALLSYIISSVIIK